MKSVRWICRTSMSLLIFGAFLLNHVIASQNVVNTLPTTTERSPIKQEVPSKVASNGFKAKSGNSAPEKSETHHESSYAKKDQRPSSRQKQNESIFIRRNESNLSADNSHSLTGKNFSEAFNLKQLLFFENSSQNNGITSIPSPAHIYNIAEKTGSSANLEEQITNRLETLFLNDSLNSKFHPNDSKLPEEDDKNVASSEGEPDSDDESTVEERVDVPISDKNELDLKEAEIQEEFIKVSAPEADIDSSLTGQEAVKEAPKENVEENPIPVFSEWAQKQMEEAEKKLEQDVANSSSNKNKTTDRQKTHTVKLRAKNYASPDCGAKIIAANQESDNVGHVLSSSKDEYLISVCTSRIWFVVELCEPIQAEKVELANFELFSSSPNEFSVSVSNRYPTRDWSNVGQFTAKDERNIQKFDLNPHLFGKFIRVDIHSHYNKEHFCPVSLFRVYGTSEFEAFETENQPPQLDDYDDDEEAVDSGKLKTDNNLFKSASDAVLSMVKKAAQVLTKGEGVSDKNFSLKNTETNKDCITLARVVICENCPEKMFAEVTELLSCRNQFFVNLLKMKLLREVIYKTDLCYKSLGVDIFVQQKFASQSESSNDLRRDFISKIFPQSYFVALCNIAGMSARRRNTNASFEDPKQESIINNLTIEESGINLIETEKRLENDNFDLPLVDKDLEEKQKIMTEKPQKEPSTSEKIEIQNTLQKEENKLDENTKSSQLLEENLEQSKEEDLSKFKDDRAEEIPIVNDTEKPTQSDDMTGDKKKLPETEPENGNTIKLDSNQQNWDSLELSDQQAIEDTNPPSFTTQPTQKVHSESVFLRLSNRIKSLERNMSLSSQYLEELSRRYKKQVEELQQSFSKTILAFEENSRQTGEQRQQLEKENQQLKRDISEIVDNFLAWKSILFYLCVFVCVQIVLMAVLFIVYVRSRSRERRSSQTNRVSRQRRKSSTERPLRRNSTEGIIGRSTSSLNEVKKRPSEEALQIVGTYTDLLINSSEEVKKEENSLNGNGKNKKKSKARNRKTSLPNQVYDGSSSSGTRKRDSHHENDPKRLHHSNSLIQNISHGHEERKESVMTEDVIMTDDNVLLEENDEFYLPGSDLAYNEFMPGGPTSQKEEEERTEESLTAKARRLSSPAFLKSALSRRSSRKNKSNLKLGKNTLVQNEEDGISSHSNGSWDWYKLRKSPSQESSQENPSSSNLVVNSATNGFPNGSASTVSSKEGSTSKKSGSFKKIFRKVF